MRKYLSMLFLASFAVFFGSAGNLHADGTKFDKPIFQPGPGSLVTPGVQWSCRYSSSVSGHTVLDGGGLAEGTLVTGDVVVIDSNGNKQVYEDANYILDGTIKRICASEPTKAESTPNTSRQIAPKDYSTMEK